jgi:hypothetical protein
LLILIDGRWENRIMKVMLLLAMLLLVSTSMVVSVAGARTSELVVTTASDSGEGSLRMALEIVSAHPDQAWRIHLGDREGPFSEPVTIRLDSPLPEIRSLVTIDGFIRGLLWQAYGLTLDGNGGRIFEVAPEGELILTGITLTGGHSEYGGAIFNRGRLVVDSLTLMNNHAIGQGGAIFNAGGELVVINSSLIDNQATEGGALASQGGQMRLIHVTLASNRAGLGAGLFSMGELYLANSIVAGSHTSQCVHVDLAPAVHISNLIQGSELGCGRPILDADPRFEALGYYNGPTPTLPLSGISPAINLADDQAAVDRHGRRLVWDQRGNGDPRFAGGYADLGAFERQGPLPGHFEVNSLTDNGLRVCTGQGQDDCPLRAAIQLAAVARHSVPVHFHAGTFSQPTTLHLDSDLGLGDVDLVLDGLDQVTIDIHLPCDVIWQARGGVRLVVLQESNADASCSD